MRIRVIKINYIADHFPLEIEMLSNAIHVHWLVIGWLNHMDCSFQQITNSTT